MSTIKSTQDIRRLTIVLRDLNEIRGYSLLVTPPYSLHSYILKQRIEIGECKSANKNAIGSSADKTQMIFFDERRIPHASLALLQQKTNRCGVGLLG